MTVWSNAIRMSGTAEASSIWDGQILRLPSGPDRDGRPEAGRDPDQPVAIGRYRG
jgi:hypothetical protein